MKGISPGHFWRHRYFYAAGLAALATLGATRAAGMMPPLPSALAGDVFYLLYLALALRHAVLVTPAHLRKLAETEDEGIVLIVLITLASICFSLVSLFALLDGKDQGESGTALMVLSIASAPLGWLMLHTVAAFHYAHRFYAPRRTRGKTRAQACGLTFPGTEEPTSWDFLYFSFVVGMTAQVSDVQVTETHMRQFVWLHGMVSFFYNTVLIALAVNIAVAVTMG